MHNRYLCKNGIFFSDHYYFILIILFIELTTAVSYSRNNYRNMTKLSVNINKLATLRNARGGNVPDVVKVALDCEKFGAEGITVHPGRMNGTSQEQMYMP